MLLLCFNFLDIGVKNEKIWDNKDLRWKKPEIHKKLNDRESRILILSPWHTETRKSCDMDFDISAFMVFDFNFTEYTKAFVENDTKQRFRKVEYESFTRISRPLYYHLNCTKINFSKTGLTSKFGELFVFIPELWYYDTNAIFYYQKRMEKLKSKTINDEKSKHDEL